AGFNLLIGNFLFTYLTAAGAMRRGYYDLVRYALFSPLYWALMSVGAWKGLAQLVTRPSYWEETVHRLADSHGGARWAVGVAAPAATALRERRAGRVRSGPAVFGVSFTVYALLGLWTTLHQQVIVGDALARLEHAYAIWWNRPAKLTAIGFYWPPFQTLLLGPFGLLRPLARSLPVLPSARAIFGALLPVGLNRVLARTEIAPRMRPATGAWFGLTTPPV